MQANIVLSSLAQCCRLNPECAECLLMPSFSQVGALSKDMMLRKPPGITTLADSGLQGGSISPTTADPAGIRAAGYSPQSDATSTMPLGHASEATSASHLPQGMAQLQEVQQTVITPQGVHRTSLGAFPETCQVCLQHCALCNPNSCNCSQKCGGRPHCCTC